MKRGFIVITAAAGAATVWTPPVAAGVGGFGPDVVYSDCTSVTPGLPLARAKREAREIILAFIAGAAVRTLNGVVTRVGGELVYETRPWIMVESTLASPGVVTPPLLAGPEAGDLGEAEYKLYRDGVRNATTLAPVGGVLNGVGLRNPDRVDTSASQAVIDAANDIPSQQKTVRREVEKMLAGYAGPRGEQLENAQNGRRRREAR